MTHKSLALRVARGIVGLTLRGTGSLIEKFRLLPIKPHTPVSLLSIDEIQGRLQRFQCLIFFCDGEGYIGIFSYVKCRGS